jgi:hypothetical protein
VPELDAAICGEALKPDGVTPATMAVFGKTAVTGDAKVAVQYVKTELGGVTCREVT